jgi:molybdenum cofactor cytidylyltransferase
VHGGARRGTEGHGEGLRMRVCRTGYCGIMTGAMVAGVILAAGYSVRMGQPKALLRISPAGPTFLLQIVGTLRRAGLDTIIVVVGVDGERIRAAVATVTPPVQVAENEDPSRGQLSSLITAIDLADRPEVEAVLVTPVDQPLISVETVTRIIATYQRSRAPIVRPAHGARHGHPVIFDRSVFDELRRADLSAGARSVIRAHEAAVIDVPVVDEGAFTDIDTRDDYERLFGPFRRVD